MSLIQLSLSRASATFGRFDFDRRNKFGAISFGRRPESHPECQKLVMFPSLNVMLVQAAKSCWSASSQGVSVPTHALSVAIHSCQS